MICTLLINYIFINLFLKQTQENGMPIFTRQLAASCLSSMYCFFRLYSLGITGCYRQVPPIGIGFTLNSLMKLRLQIFYFTPFTATKNAHMTFLTPDTSQSEFRTQKSRMPSFQLPNCQCSSLIKKTGHSKSNLLYTKKEDNSLISAPLPVQKQGITN